MTIIRSSDGTIIRRSHNLRGLIDHARRAVPVSAVFCDSQWSRDQSEDARHILKVWFDNGDVAVSAYAQADIAARFLNSRRSWPRLNVFGLPAFVETYHSGAKL